MKICPFCAEEIKAEAIKCKHCGSMLEQVHTQSATQAPKKNILEITLTVIGLIVLVAVITVFGLRSDESPTSVVGGFLIELKAENIDLARKYLTNDYSSTFSDQDLKTLAKKVLNESWFSDPDSIVIDESKASESILALKNGSIATYIIRLEKTFWGWKITGIH